MLHSVRLPAAYCADYRRGAAMLAGEPMKLHLVDATFELFRAYYSRPPRRAPDGRPVNAVQGLIDSMLSLLREPDVTHIGAATDYVIESWRNDLYPGYKSSAGMDPDLMAQFRDAERALEALGMPVWADGRGRGRRRDRHRGRALRVRPTRRAGHHLLGRQGSRAARRRRSHRAARPDARGSPTTRPASSRSSASRRSRSRTTSRSSATAATASPGSPAGVRRAPPPSWQSSATIDDDPAVGARLGARPAQRQPPGRHAPGPAPRGRPVSHASRRSTATPTSPTTPTLDDLEWHGVRRDQFLALCDELGFDTVRERVHRWAD